MAAKPIYGYLWVRDAVDSEPRKIGDGTWEWVDWYAHNLGFEVADVWITLVPDVNAKRIEVSS